MGNLDHLKVPTFCPVCEELMKGKSTYTFYDWGCCVLCHIDFIEGSETRITRWKSGWRPTQEQIMIARDRLS